MQEGDIILYQNLWVVVENIRGATATMRLQISGDYWGGDLHMAHGNFDVNIFTYYKHIKSHKWLYWKYYIINIFYKTYDFITYPFVDDGCDNIMRTLWIGALVFFILLFLIFVNTLRVIIFG